MAKKSGKSDMAEEKKTGTVDEYISAFPTEVQKIMKELRKVIHEAVPGLEETISWSMPTFKLKGKNIVHFAGFAKHIGLYPAPPAVEEFSDMLAGYKQGKGSIQFPLNKPVPFDIVKKIVKFNADRIT